MKAAKLGTIRKGRIIHPILEELGLDPASIESVRTAGHGRDSSLHHANGLRLWENDDIVPRPDDVFQERLYCVRWIETRIDKNPAIPAPPNTTAPSPNTTSPASSSPSTLSANASPTGRKRVSSFTEN